MGILPKLLEHILSKSLDSTSSTPQFLHFMHQHTRTLKYPKKYV